MDKRLLFNVVYGSSVLICLTLSFIYAFYGLWKFVEFGLWIVIIIEVAYILFEEKFNG